MPPVVPPVVPPVEPPVVPATGTACTSVNVSTGCCVQAPFVGACTSGFAAGAACSPIIDFAPGDGC